MSRENKILPQVFDSIESAENLSEIFETYFDRGVSLNYKNVVELTSSSASQSEKLMMLKSRVESKLGISDSYQFDKLWLVESLSTDTDEAKLPYIPHIDYKRYLKVMIYVDSVTEKSGPLHAVKVDPEDYEGFRKCLKPDYKIRQENEIQDLDLGEYKAYTGEEGMVILFDTNCPHFAGQVSEGNVRRVFRFDYYKTAWRKEKNGLLVKIRNLIS